MGSELQPEKSPDVKPRITAAEEPARAVESSLTPQAAGNQALQSLLGHQNVPDFATGQAVPTQEDAEKRAKQSALDAEILSDFLTIKDLLDSTFYTYSVEQKVITILWRWAREPFHSRPPRNPAEAIRSEYLDKLLLKLHNTSKRIGIITDQITSYYSLMFNHFDRVNELRFIRNVYSRLFRGEEGIAEVKFFGMGKSDFFGSLWEDVKSGAVADRIGNYFLGMLEAGKGLLEGVALLLTDPMKVIEGIGNLPKTAKALWKNRDKLWNAFLTAPPDQQARMIGRIFGEAEILIYTVGAGGGARAATATPELAAAEAIVPVAGRGGAAAAALTGGGAITIDLGKLGEASRLTSLMAMTAEAGSKGQQKAKELQEEETVQAAKPKTEKTTRVEPYEKEIEKIPESPEAIEARKKLARDFSKQSLPEGSEVRTRRVQRTEAGRAQQAETGLDVELDITLPDGTRFSPDGVKYVGSNKYVFLEHKEVLTIWEKSHFSRPTAIPELDAMLNRHAQIFLKLKPKGCASFFYSTGSSQELANLIAERISLLPRWAREALLAPPLP